MIPGLVFVISAVLKPFAGNYLCGEDPWEAANLVMWPAEVWMAWSLLVPGEGSIRGLLAGRRRRLASLFGAPLMFGAMGVLTFLHFFGHYWNLKAADVSACGCFGPVLLPYGLHMVILGLTVACLGAVFLHEETQLMERQTISTG